MLFEPADEEDLSEFLKAWPAEDPLLVLGGLANTIVRDGGVRGCVVMLGKSFAGVRAEGTKIFAGAGTLNGTVAALAAKSGIGGLEFLSGVPGTIGGALRMNAGAYGSETKEMLREVRALNRAGDVQTLYPEDMRMAYRSCGAPDDYIFTRAVFEGAPEETATVRERLKTIKAQRQDTQPIAEKTGGSTFANPSPEMLQAAGHAPGLRAWQLVDMAGARGLKIGGAQMSEKHCNFMINTGEATAADLENLGEEVRARVLEKCGVELHWEIRRVGER